MGTSGEIEGVRDQAHEFIDQKLNNVASSSESGENEQPKRQAEGDAEREYRQGQRLNRAAHAVNRSPSRQQQIFMMGVKFHQRLRISTYHGFLPARIGVDPLDKILAQSGIVQPVLFFDRHQRTFFHEGGSEQNTPTPRRNGFEL
jgi:hypothetical protein